MVLVAAIALASSTYAWFVTNNTVKATTGTISAQSNAPYLMIDKTAITENSKTSITFMEGDTNKNTKLYPSQVVKSKTDTTALFQSAYASKADDATELQSSRYDVGDATTATKQEFALEETFKSL